MPDNQTTTSFPTVETTAEYGVEVCRNCDSVKPEHLVELDNPSTCPQCGAQLYGLNGTEIIDA